MVAPRSIAVAVCTHRRNGPLERLLTSVRASADRVRDRAHVSLVVVDDNPDGRAEPVADRFADVFPGRVHYRHVGSENISTARNVALDAARRRADWIAMTDDDQVVVPAWLEALIDTQRRTGADAVTGPVFLRYPEDSPEWLFSQPFQRIMEAERHPDRAAVTLCSTGNVLIRTRFLDRNPGLRFRPELGTIGGEDMVFFREAIAGGLSARYAADAVCYAMQPRERATYRFQMRSCYWMGNTEFVTNHVSGAATRSRLALRGGRRLAAAMWHPASQVSQGQPPQWRYTLALMARAGGMLAGVAGVEVAHR